MEKSLLKQELERIEKVAKNWSKASDYEVSKAKNTGKGKTGAVIGGIIGSRHEVRHAVRDKFLGGAAKAAKKSVDDLGILDRAKASLAGNVGAPAAGIVGGYALGKLVKNRSLAKAKKALAERDAKARGN